jgi:PAS domain S-box-containing protein
VLGSLIEGVCYVNTSGEVQYMNAAAERMLGYNSDQVRGKRLHDLLHLGCVAGNGSSCSLVKAMHAGHPCHAQEEILTTNSGCKLTVEYTAAPVTDTVTLGAVMMFRDISERKRAEQAIQASEKMAATGRIAATISHELRNPLDSVMQLIYLIKQSGKLGEAERQHIDLIDQELRRMTEVAQQTLAMHRQAPAMVPVNLSKLIDGVTLLYGKKVKTHKIQLDKKYEWQGEVPGFPAELRQVFTNLIVNAVDAMPSGGRMCIHVRQGREFRGAGRTGVLISLLDNGTGIPAEARRHLFQPFFTTKGEKGSGVGLWVSSGIVQRHSGSIRVHSDARPGRSYTCFRVFLPAQQGPIGMPKPVPEQKSMEPLRQEQPNAA